jgi:hypothetical protein
VVCVRLCARINLTTQNIVDAILNALLLACAKLGSGIMQVGFLMALARVPVMDFFTMLDIRVGLNCLPPGDPQGVIGG